MDKEDIKTLNNLLSTDISLFLLELKKIVKKTIGMKVLSEKTGLHRQTLYKVLSGHNDPLFKNVVKVLNALDAKLIIQWTIVTIQKDSIVLNMMPTIAKIVYNGLRRHVEIQDVNSAPKDQRKRLRRRNEF